MKIPDANVLLYAHVSSSPFHIKASRWLNEALSGPSEPVGIATSVALTFVRLISNSKVVPNPLSIGKACQIVEAWFAAGAIWCEPGPSHFFDVERLMTQAQGGLNLLPDAHLAALALHHRATIYTNDRDFQRFPGLRVKNPLV